MENNDNPNVDAGIEDAILGNELYNILMTTFLRRLDNRANRKQEGIA